MSQYTLTLLDATGIQDYIFASNRLQENIGASELVYRATSLWVFAALEQLKISHNIQNPSDLDWDFTADRIESGKLDAEVIQAAGGNTVILFREQAASRAFVRALTLRLLREAPGLTVLAYHDDEFDFDHASLPEARGQLQDNMSRHKLSRLPSTPTLGLGVTAMCDSTGLPAVRTPEGTQHLAGRAFKLLVSGQDEQAAERDRLISRETTFKLAARDLANERLRHVLGTVAEWFDFPADIDNLGRISGEESYVAVIHADGNGMGKHVGAVVDGLDQSQPRPIYNRAYIQAMRAFSKNLERASQAALVEIVETLAKATDEKSLLVAEKIPLVIVTTKQKTYRYLPFRPLVFGGDDVTFLCNGQLGVELATRYLEAFERHTAAQGLKDFYACAGISIVKMHYPFARAYKLSEELTASAKKLVKKLYPEDKTAPPAEQLRSSCSALDWHFAQSGLSGSLEIIRQREYMSSAEASLCIRPLTLKVGLRSWQNIAQVMAGFAEKWADKHNKVVGLREPLRKNSAAVEKYLQDYGLKALPVFPGVKAEKTGWLDEVCYYFDAIELFDHHVSLEPQSQEVKK